MNAWSSVAVRARLLARETVLYSWVRYFTPAVPLATQVYEWAPKNVMVGITLPCDRLASHSGGGGEGGGGEESGQKYSFSLLAIETGVSSSLVDGQLARMKTFHLLLSCIPK